MGSVHLLEGGRAVDIIVWAVVAAFETNGNCVAEALNSDQIASSLLLLGSRYRQRV